MITASGRISTAEQLFAAQDAGPCELIRGELRMMSPAGPNHGRITNELAFHLTSFVKKHSIGAVYAAETGFMLQRNPDTVRAPDVAFVRTDRLRETPMRGYFPGPPDLAVEVLSPDDTASYVLEKVDEWLRAGTKSVWIVDPQRKTVSIDQTNAPVRTLSIQEQLIDELVLPGFKLKVREWFE